jgi:hypothetical protein
MFEIDPETYRYFFSASAQVFAAIFAVVAIAVSFRLSELRAEFENARASVVRVAHVYVMEVSLHIQEGGDNSQISSASQNWMRGRGVGDITLYSEEDLFSVCKDIEISINKRYNQKKLDEDRYQRIKKEISLVVERYENLVVYKKSLKMQVNKTVLISGIMIAISLISLWLKYHCIYFIVGVLAIMIAALFFISVSFISIFKTQDKL